MWNIACLLNKRETDTKTDVSHERLYLKQNKTKQNQKTLTMC